ncbi:hypothetical protein [Sinorhizobium sp. BG8]|uniref:hypothetical protein n=1 Tax=Sinorhizobium sp. BG8 TaxID=2613773 RepID=UPI00193DA72E|nr:hypothetical protein [Sinorhizobium sp. BG8]QRM55586.1 hypothetical protein F3Y30_14440 [Sinorhizobium sp. BG8]
MPIQRAVLAAAILVLPVAAANFDANHVSRWKPSTKMTAGVGVAAIASGSATIGSGSNAPTEDMATAVGAYGTGYDQGLQAPHLDGLLAGRSTLGAPQLLTGEPSYPNVVMIDTDAGSDNAQASAENALGVSPDRR